MLGGEDTKTTDLAFNKEIIHTSGLRVVRVDAKILWDDFSITGGIVTETGNVAYIDIGEFVVFIYCFLNFFNQIDTINK